MPELADFQPGPTDRAGFFGMTGSGKTTLAQMMLRLRKYVVVLDVKGSLDWKGFHVHKTLASLAADNYPRLIYRPVYAELESPEALDNFFAWVYDRQNTTLYVDEIHGVAQGEKYPYYLGACLQRGREMGVRVWFSTQRPKRIPSILLSESEHLYVFRLKLEQDRDRIEEVSGIDPDSIGALPKHWFFYAPQSGSTSGPHTLKL